MDNITKLHAKQCGLYIQIRVKTPTTNIKNKNILQKIILLIKYFFFIKKKL